jgi:hypothetical protein
MNVYLDLILLDFFLYLKIEYCFCGSLMALKGEIIQKSGTLKILGNLLGLSQNSYLFCNLNE